MVHVMTAMVIGLVWTNINIVGIPLRCLGVQHGVNSQMYIILLLLLLLSDGCLWGLAAVPYLTTDLHAEIVGRCGVPVSTWNLLY